MCICVYVCVCVCVCVCVWFCVSIFKIGEIPGVLLLHVSRIDYINA